MYGMVPYYWYHTTILLHLQQQQILQLVERTHHVGSAVSIRSVWNTRHVVSEELLRPNLSKNGSTTQGTILTSMFRDHHIQSCFHFLLTVDSGD